MKLSVVIPTHETRELTLRCLAALWLCNPAPNEVIVVDDGSNDNTAHSVLRKYPRHIVVRLPERHGFSAAANHGLARASGDLILLLNSDTEVQPAALGAVIDAFDRDPDLGIAGAALRHPDGAPQWSGGRMPTALWYFALASGLPTLLGRLRTWRRLRSPSGSGGGNVDWVAGTAMVIRRKVWEDLGPFDLGYKFYCQDLDLCYNAAAAGWSIRVIPEFQVYHQHGGTISNAKGAVGPTHPEFMWTDFLRFVRRRKGTAAALKSTRALRIGGKLRLVGRRLASPWIPESQRSDWRAETSAYAAALRALDRPSPPDQSPSP